MPGRSPSSPSQDRDSQWHMTKDSPLTVAGAAAALGKPPRTAFPFDPQTGEPSPIMVEVWQDRSQSRPETLSVLAGRVRLFCRMRCSAQGDAGTGAAYQG